MTEPEPTEEQMAELADWIASRPPALLPVMDRFPPSSYVKAKEDQVLLCPAPGVVGMVVSYEHNEETDRVTLNVEGADQFVPFLTWKAECDPDWLEVVDSELQREWYERAKAMRA